MPQVDKETSDIYREGETVSNFVDSDGWRWVKDRFTQKIMDLQSIKNLDKTKSAMLMQREVMMRENVVEVLMEIIREVEGRASQHKGNKTLAPKPDEHIGFID